MIANETTQSTIDQMLQKLTTITQLLLIQKVFHTYPDLTGFLYSISK